MRLLKTLLAVVLGSCSLFSQTPAQHGIQASDLDRKADPCNDFYEFANGSWRTNNPIPPSMSRWSRRWAAGELSKNQLKITLDEISSKQSWPASSVEQLIGDYYASCMDESRINKLGAAPIQPWLADIDAMRNSAGVQRMIQRFHHQAMFVPFALASAPDNHDPSQTIANVGASGLGLPDRDYYLKPEQRFQEAREKYHAHVANIFKLAGYSEQQAKAAAETVFQMEKKLAEASPSRARSPRIGRPGKRADGASISLAGVQPRRACLPRAWT